MRQRRSYLLLLLVFPPAPFLANVGQVVHNGTTVQMAFMSVFDQYNMRLTMVNRGTNDVLYAIGFTPPTGATVTPGTAATGTLPANTSVTIKMVDVFSVDVGTRTSGTLTIVSPANAIDVTMTQVNLADGGTDTVTLK